MTRPTMLLILLLTMTGHASESLVFGDALYAIPRAAPVSKGEQILLSEVATIINCPVDWEKRVSEISVGNAAQPGRTRVLQRQEIVHALRKAQFTGVVDIAGTDEISVVSSSQVITGKAMIEAAVKDIHKLALGNPDLHVKVETLLVPLDVELRPEAVEIQTEWPTGGPKPGTQSVRVRLLQDGRKSAESLLTLKIRMYGPVPCSKSAIRAGELLTEQNTGNEQREISADNTAALPLGSLIGLRARADISSGQALTRSMVVEPLLIHRGDSVTVRIKCGNLIIAATAESRNDAARGEVVRLMMPQSEGEVLARAIGTREARIGD